MPHPRRLAPRTRPRGLRVAVVARGAGAARRGHLARGPRLALRRRDRGGRCTRTRTPRRGHATSAAPAPVRLRRRRSPRPAGRSCAEFRERIAPYTYNAQHPGSFSYFTPPPLPVSIAGRGPGPVDPSGRRRLARRTDRRVRGGGGDVVAPRALRHRPRRLGHPHVRRRDGEPDGDDGRARRAPPGAPRRRRPAAAGRGPRGRPRLRRATRRTSPSGGRSTPGLPRRHPARRSPATTRSGCAPEPVAAAIDADRGSRADAARDRRRRRHDEHRRRRRPARAGGDRRARAPLAPRRRGLRRRRPPVRARGDHDGGPRTIADSITVDPHKWFFQAYDIGGLVVRRRRETCTGRSR